MRIFPFPCWRHGYWDDESGTSSRCLLPAVWRSALLLLMAKLLRLRLRLLPWAIQLSYL
jgi:hypothetical protein